MDAKTLESRLYTIEGWKKICKGGFLGGNAKKSFANYQAATRKGVSKLHAIRRDRYDDSHYAIFAFSTMDDFSDAEIGALVSFAREIDLDSIRYESKELTYLDCMRNFQQDLDVNDGDQNQISIALTDEQSGRFAFIEARFEETPLDMSFVAWAFDGRKILVYPITV